MPIDLNKYPPNWKTIALQVKEKSGWTCEKCQRPCRKPGVDWEDFKDWLLSHPQYDWYAQTEEEVACEESGERGFVQKAQRFTLTVAHWPDPDPMNVSPENLHAWCAPCHLAADAELHARNRTATHYRKLEERGQLSLL